MKKTHLKPIISAAACGLSLWSVDANAAIAFEDHFYDGGVKFNTPPALGDWVTSGYTDAQSESDSAVRWTAQGGWGWAGSNLASADTYDWPTGAQVKSVEWKIGPLIVTKNGAQSWADIRFQCGLYSAAGSRSNADLYGFRPGCIAIQLNMEAGSTVAYADLRFKDAAVNADGDGISLPGQVNNGIDPTLSHILRLDMTETVVRYYIDNNLVVTAPLTGTGYNLGLTPVAPATATEFSSGFFINSWGGRIDDGEGLISLDRITLRDSLQTVNIDLPTEPVYPAPKLSTEAAVRGLHILNEEGQYRRQTLRTTGANYSWVEGTFPKTYSFTISQAPAQPNYDAVMYFSPYGDYSNSSPDYYSANCAVLRLARDGANLAFSFAYKVNAANSNGPGGNDIRTLDSVPSLGLGGQLARINTASSYIGKWSITFTDARNFTLSTPLNETASGTMLPATSAVFVNPMMVAVGTSNVEDNATRANGFNEAVYSNITMSGVPNPIADNFTTSVISPLFTNAGETQAANFAVGPDAKFFVRRNGGSNFWLVRESTDLGLAVPWALKLNGVLSTATTASFPVTTADLQANPKNFWRLTLDAPLAPQAP